MLSAQFGVKFNVFMLILIFKNQIQKKLATEDTENTDKNLSMLGFSVYSVYSVAKD